MKSTIHFLKTKDIDDKKSCWRDSFPIPLEENVSDKVVVSTETIKDMTRSGVKFRWPLGAREPIDRT